MKLIPTLVFIFFVSVGVAQRKYTHDSASINFLLPDSVKATQFYASVSGSGTANAFYGTTFKQGKIGFQLRSKQKSFIFSINTKGVSLAKGLYVDSIKPGTFQWKYNWQDGINYKLLVTTISDSATRSIIYTGYVFLPEKEQWKLLASYKSIEGAGFITSPSARIMRGKQNRKSSSLSVEQLWIQRRNGSWKQLTDRAFDNSTGRFALTSDTGNLIIRGKRNPVNASAAASQGTSRIYKVPLVNVTNHLDSLAQTTLDKEEILSAVLKRQIDTTGAIGSVYYNILKEGSGTLVKVSDTLSVFYKGWLLKTGQVFDQTKEKPASFPLERLIKGWQIGLPKCRVGGEIRLFIPSGLAYSIRSRSKDIPPNSVLVFDIEVLEAKAAL